MTYVNKKPIYYLLLLLIIILVTVYSSQKTAYAAHGSQITPTKDWKVVDNPGFPISSNSGLNAVAALSARSVWAVGYAYSRTEVTPAPTGLQALIEQWNGNSWRIIASPVIAGASYVSLSSIVARSSNDMWAAGGSFATDYSTTRQLIEHWDGRGWHSVKPSHIAGASYSNIFGITAVAANDIWAIGGYARAEDHGLHHALIEHWNGNAWVSMPAPKPMNSVYEELQSIVALNTKDIWAVGISLTGSYAHRSLIEHWDGRSWSVISSNDRLASLKSNRTLNAVAARSSSDVWAVGQADDRGPAQSFIKHWNGKLWSDVPGPGSMATKPVADGGNLLGLTVLSTKDIWAVGSFSDETRVEHWNGKAWSIVATPTLSVGTSMLSGIVHSPYAHQLWAVGSTNQQGLSEIRTDRY